jgi:hypothetical protein
MTRYAWRLFAVRYRYWVGATLRLINGDHMTVRQQRLQFAGAVLVRGATLIGGAVGLFGFFIALTGQQRLVFLFLVGALAMPAVLVALAATGLDRGRVAVQPLLTIRNVPYLMGAVLLNVLVFVEPNAYLAVVFVIISGLTLAGIVRLGTTSHPIG